MIVLHVSPAQWSCLNGIAACVPALAAAQHAMPGCCVALAMSSADPGDPPARGYPVFGRPRMGRDGRLDLTSPFNRPDLVVFHSTYLPAHVRLAAALRRAGVPYLICPHGGMTRAARANKAWKKRMANLLVFNRYVRGAVALQCLTPREAAETADWRRPIFVVGNGTEIPPESQLARPNSRGTRRLVFIGRLAVHHKGLDLLLEACAQVRTELCEAGAAVELYGPDHEGGAAWLAARIRRAGLASIVRLAGEVRGPVKRDVLASADVFLHTSRWEGHPMAVLEALAHGVPCLVTPETNVADEVAAAGAGWSVDLAPGSIAAGLRRVLAAEAPALAAAGSRARTLARERFTWEQVGRATLAEYHRCASRATAPAIATRAA